MYIFSSESAEKLIKKLRLEGALIIISTVKNTSAVRMFRKQKLNFITFSTLKYWDMTLKSNEQSYFYDTF